MPSNAKPECVALCCPDCRAPLRDCGAPLRDGGALRDCGTPLRDGGAARAASAGGERSAPLADEPTAFECSGCGARFAASAGVPRLIGKQSQLNTSEIATQDYVARDYDGLRYERASSIKYHEDTMQQLVDLAPPRGAILDAGCGTGAFLEFARRRQFPIDSMVGVDVSRAMLAHARRRLSEGGPAPLLLEADACRLPFPDDSFDRVYARGLIHHLPAPRDGLLEIRRVLKPGGIAVVLDPNRTVISSLPRYLLRYTARFDADHKNFRVTELEALVSSVMTREETRFFGYFAYPLLGFPDLIDFERLGVQRWADALLRLDRKLGEVPGVRRMGWGVMISARK